MHQSSVYIYIYIYIYIGSLCIDFSVLRSSIRDYGLAISNTTSRDIENIKKGICRIFNHKGPRITFKANKQTISFLDITFNLNKNTYQPFTKPNTTLTWCTYVHREINHPPTTTKNSPAGINKRLSSLSSDKTSFNQVTPPYQKELDECRHQYTQHYEPPTTNILKSRQRSKHICTLKENNINHFISWHIPSSRSHYNSANKRYNLCLKERLLIISRPELSSLNKRNELMSSCRHRNKTLLRNN